MFISNLCPRQTGTLADPDAKPSVPLPVAGFALKLATPDFYYSLGTTIYLSGSVTQIFSEAQFANLRTLTAPTITTTSLVERSTDSSTTSLTTTLIPIWVQAGGFYWSPVPIPTPLPIKIPSLPKFPPILNPPCFKFLDIFSIYCPDKSKSTSTFKSGKSVEPTFTSSCGSPCTVNCHTTGIPTSTECATETATNYWVSCTSSTCVNTSSNTVTGCAVELSVTTFTATDYCPLVALPTERVFISGSLYTVTSGSITVNGVGYSVLAVATSSVMVLGGLTATLYPPAVVSSASITASGCGTNLLTPTSTVVPVQSTTTSLSPIPTLSDPNDEQAYCFRQHNDGNYVPFNITGEQEVLFSLCSQGNTLSPGDPAYTYVYTDPIGVNIIAQLNWASDQTGWSLEDGWSLEFELDDCEAHFDYNVCFCDDESIDDNYGGAYI
ncbi:hypothetical protein BPAE_0325g00030 [Botrytis paeoniae]|uniref:Uncharacterized protein n=1 Tax=Botrytis paeoniae TaxID=278948 RepID=A0A4Z1F6Q0_9HELO|nr:hypothetical protein BPAE_0325g00030 [Botrytis paeoniae]